MSMPSTPDGSARPERVVVHVYAAEGTHDENVQPVTIVIDGSVPTKPTRELQQAMYATEGAALAEAIWRACPGGTVDALIVALMVRRASLYRIPFGDVVVGRL